MKKVLVTGASGFIGRELCKVLKKNGYFVRGAVRKRGEIQKISADEVIEIGDIGLSPDWSTALKDIDVIIHLAAKVHDSRADLIVGASEYNSVNVKATQCLARAAALQNIKRLIFLSTIKVNGEWTLERAFTETDPPRPFDIYAISKWKAEQKLHQIAEGTGLEVVIVRVPLVHGPGVKGNMLRLLHCVNRGIPLPLANVDNRRSFIGVENLADLLIRCIQNPGAAGETFLAADGEDLSTPELIRRIAAALGCSARLFPFTKAIMRAGARLLGKGDMFDRLYSSLVIDTSKAKQLLDWSGRVSVNEGLAKMTSWYLSEYIKKDAQFSS